MMMTTNTTLHFFRTNIRKNFLLNSIKTAFLLSFLIFFISCNDKDTLSLESIKTETGWGYVIKNNEQIIIRQSIIPVIANKKSFKNEQEALKVGNLVLQKLKNNNSPTITKKDLILLSIKT